MPSEERQRIIESNKSLRIIKNELENLLEKGAIDDSAYDSISSLLPAETPLSGHLSAPRNAASGLASPAHSAVSPASNVGSPVNAPPGPPSYNQSTGNSSTPSKPVLTHARALYHYQASDARDVGFDRDDRIAVFEYMNADWWMGQNLRTGQEGIFPRSYVAPEPPAGGYGGGPNEKQGYNDPYNASAPPMAIAAQGGAVGAAQAQQQPQEPGKVEQGAKKFGKKLGNAAIFGAGATIGSNIVNSIF